MICIKCQQAQLYSGIDLDKKHKNTSEDQTVLHRCFLSSIQFHSQFHKQHRLFGMAAAFGNGFHIAYGRTKKFQMPVIIQRCNGVAQLRRHIANILSLYELALSKVGTYHSPELSAPLKPKCAHRSGEICKLISGIWITCLRAPFLFQSKP